MKTVQNQASAITTVSPNPFSPAGIEHWPLCLEGGGRFIVVCWSTLVIISKARSEVCTFEGFPYTIASRSRSLLRFSILLVIISGILMLHCFLLLKLIA